MRSKRARARNVKAMSEEDAGIAMMAQTLPPLVVSLKKIDVINDIAEITGDRVVAKGKRVAPKIRVSGRRGCVHQLLRVGHRGSRVLIPSLVFHGLRRACVWA